MSERFVVGCGTVVVNAGGLVLVVRQQSGYWGGKWIFPGGKLELGETLEACARREALEETGCDFDLVRQVGAYVSYDPSTPFEKQVVLVYFLGRYRSGVATAGDGVIEAKWMDTGAIENLAAKGEVPALLIHVLHDALHR